MTSAEAKKGNDVKRDKGRGEGEKREEESYRGR